MDNLEGKAVDFVARLAPWCAPIPTAFLVGRATMLHLSWPWPVALVAAVIVESLGLATTATALTLYQYNQSKRKADTGAPFALAAFLVVIYFLVATGLTVVLDIFPRLSTYAPAIFPALSLTGVTVLALRSDHKRRLEAIAQERAERKADRQANRQSNLSSNLSQVSSVTVQKASNNGQKSTVVDTLQAGRKAKLDTRLDTLLDVLSDNPDLGITDAARSIGVSRQTVYGYIENLEAAGRLHKNGNGWEVKR